MPSAKLGVNRLDTVAPGGLAVSSGVVVRVAAPLAMGASLTAATAVLSGTAAALTAVVPPLWAPETSTPAIAWAPESRSAPLVVPVMATSVELSISRAVSGGGAPLKFGAGLKSIFVAAERINAEASLTLVGMSVQVVPPSVE